LLLTYLPREINQVQLFIVYIYCPLHWHPNSCCLDSWPCIPGWDRVICSSKANYGRDFNMCNLSEHLPSYQHVLPD
jgi:hypothetical protein